MSTLERRKVDHMTRKHIECTFLMHFCFSSAVVVVKYGVVGGTWGSTVALALLA